MGLEYLHFRLINKSHFSFQGGIIGGIIAGMVTDKTGMSATTCSVMLVFAIPMMFLYENLVAEICPITEHEGVPIHNACFSWNILVLFLTGILVNGPYALITTAVSAELGVYRYLPSTGGTGTVPTVPYSANGISGYELVFSW